MKDLGASEETTSDGFTFIELDSKNLKCPEAPYKNFFWPTIPIRQQATCPEASKGCKPHGWPKGNPKWK